MSWNNKEKEKEYNEYYRESGMYQKWYEKNKEQEREKRSKYRKENPLKDAEYKKKWLNKNPWFKHFWAAKCRCTKKDSPYHKKGIKFICTLNQFREVWFRDRAFELKNPSIDRIDSSGNYERLNIRFIDRRENALQGLKNRWDKVRKLP